MIKLKQILTEITCADAFNAFGKIESVQVRNNVTNEIFVLTLNTFGSTGCTTGDKVPVIFTVDALTVKNKDGVETKSENDNDIFLTQIKRIIGQWQYSSYTDELDSSKPAVLKIYVEYYFYDVNGKEVGKARGDSVSFEKIPTGDVFNDTMIYFMLSWVVYVTGTKYEKDMRAKGGEYADYELDIDPGNVYDIKKITYRSAQSTPSTPKTTKKKTNIGTEFGDEPKHDISKIDQSTMVL